MKVEEEKDVAIKQERIVSTRPALNGLVLQRVGDRRGGESSAAEETRQREDVRFRDLVHIA